MPKDFLFEDTVEDNEDKDSVFMMAFLFDDVIIGNKIIILSVKMILI